MAVTMYIPVAEVRRRDDARPRDEGAVRFLAESMKEVGQLTPVLVRPSDGGFELIAGSHRLAAAEHLGWGEVEARYAEHDDDLRAELAMIDENLCRSELSAADSAGQLARRKAIYEELHPETKREATLRKGDNSPSRQIGETGKTERFTANAASATGRSERSVQRDTERGEKVLPEVLTLIRGTKLDSGTYLDKLKKLPANEQFTAAKRDLALSEKADAAEKKSGNGTASKPASRAPADAPAPEGANPNAHDRLIAVLDALDGIVVSNVIEQCPSRQRASLCQRASSAIDLLGNVMEEASR